MFTTPVGGITVIVKVADIPTQISPLSVYTGVTVTVLDMGAPVPLVVAKLPIGIVPDKPKPIAVLLFVPLAPVSVPAEAVNGPITVPATTDTSL
jgi:hypothetical protein